MGNEEKKSTVDSKANVSKVKKEENDSDYDYKPKLQKKSAAVSKTPKKEENDSDFDCKPKLQKKSPAVSKTPKIKKIKDENFENDTKEAKKRKEKVSIKEDKKKVVVKEEKVKKEKKVYELPGQKHDPPTERDPLRIFYESLYEQMPTSEMAATWMMEWGLLPVNVAAEVFRKKQSQKLKSPVKTAPARRKPASPTKRTPSSSAKKTSSAATDAGKSTTQKKRKMASSGTDDDDDDFMLSTMKTKKRKTSS